MRKTIFFRNGVLSLCVFLLGGLAHIQAGDDKFERGRMEQILDLVSKDVQTHFYDPQLKNLDWQELTNRSRERIRRADHLGEMIAAISALLYQLNDSHTVFIPPGRSAKVEYGFKAEPFGNEIFVYELQKDGPAAKAGLRLGDKLVGVNTFKADRGNFFEMMRYFGYLNPMMEMDLEINRGIEPKQTIRIPTKIQQRGKSMFMTYMEMMNAWDAERQFYAHKQYDGNVGYIKLRTFMFESGEVGPMMNKVKNASAVILDLRGNGGGSLDALTALSGCFTDRPYEMGQEVLRNKSEPMTVKPRRPAIASPLFILLDSSSASASEMFARDLQLRKRAIVLGDKSSGRVNSARLFWEKVGAYDLVGFGTEIAVARVVMANGEELENRGVAPDEFCIPTPDDLRNERDPCLDRALALAKKTNAAQSVGSQPR